MAKTFFFLSKNGINRNNLVKTRFVFCFLFFNNNSIKHIIINYKDNDVQPCMETILL